MALSGQHTDDCAFQRSLSRAHDERVRLAHVAYQSPLMETRPSLAALRGVAPREAQAVFAGIGVVSGQRVSEALPLDVLGLLLGAETVRRATGAEHLLVMVADQHAIEKGAEQSAVVRCSEHYALALRLIAERCDWPHMQVFLASELSARDGYRQALSEVNDRAPQEVDPYLVREVADIAYLRRCHPGLVKVGWALQPSAINVSRDERVFDACYQRWMNEEAPFLYAKSGRVLDDHRRKGPPYVTRDVGRRICLLPGEDVAAKLAYNRKRVSECTYRGVCNHLRAITRSYCRLVRPLSGTLVERTQVMLDQITGQQRLDASR